MKKGFTLIELLAVIVILAIIALIATPIILGIINDSKKSAAELSVKNYIRAVELAVSNKYVKDPTVNLNVTYEIKENGKKIQCGTSEPIDIEYEGKGLNGGFIELEKGEVIKITNGRIDNWIIYDWEKGKDIALDEFKYKEEIKVTLVKGSDFNKKIKQFVSNDESITSSTVDTTITSIEFYSNGLLPKEKKKNLEELGESNKVDVSASGDGSIIAYYDNGEVYIVSDNLISFNEDSNNMFYNFTVATKINFGKINTSGAKYMKQMFRGCNGLIGLDVSGFDTSNVLDMYYMFAECSSLTTLDLSNFNTSKVGSGDSKGNMISMFNNCINLESIDLSNFDTKNVISMGSMFNWCTKLKSLDLSNFDTRNVTSMASMFNKCETLTTLDLSSFNTSKVTNMSYMFYICKNLENLNISSFDTSSVTNMNNMFQGSSKLKPIFIGENWHMLSTATNVFNSCATEDEQQMCEPNSIEEWCIVN